MNDGKVFVIHDLRAMSYRAVPDAVAKTVPSHFTEAPE